MLSMQWNNRSDTKITTRRAFTILNRIEAHPDSPLLLRQLVGRLRRDIVQHDSPTLKALMD